MASKTKLLFLIFTLSAFSFAWKSGMEKEGKIIPFQTFKNADIGARTKPGSATLINDELEIVAGGTDIWGKHDEFHFSYKKLKGDFDLSVQIKNLSAAHKYTKAGLMARTSLSDSSQHVFFQVFPDNSPRNKNNGGCEFQYRSEIAAEMKAIYPDLKTAGNQFDVSFPNTWVRLNRKGDVFESYFSNDAKNWKLYSSFTLNMPRELFVGLAVTAHNTNDFTKSRFAAIRLKK
jgi:regulation of enolase protein 1 (concanavalin A-like superfamily)